MGEAMRVSQNFAHIYELGLRVIVHQQNLIRRWTRAHFRLKYHSGPSNDVLMALRRVLFARGLIIQVGIDDLTLVPWKPPTSLKEQKLTHVTNQMIHIIHSMAVYEYFVYIKNQFELF